MRRRPPYALVDDVDDQPFCGVLRRKDGRKVGRRLHMQVEMSLPDGFIGLEHAVMLKGRGVVDQQIDRAESGRRLAEHSDSFPRLAEIR